MTHLLIYLADVALFALIIERVPQFVTVPVFLGIQRVWHYRIQAYTMLAANLVYPILITSTEAELGRTVVAQTGLIWFPIVGFIVCFVGIALQARIRRELMIEEMDAYRLFRWVGYKNETPFNLFWYVPIVGILPLFLFFYYVPGFDIRFAYEMLLAVSKWIFSLPYALGAIASGVAILYCLYIISWGSFLTLRFLFPFSGET